MGRKDQNVKLKSSADLAVWLLTNGIFLPFAQQTSSKYGLVDRKNRGEMIYNGM